MPEINWNRAWDLILYVFCAGTIGGFLYVARYDTAEQLALILFGAFMKALGEQRPTRAQ